MTLSLKCKQENLSLISEPMLEKNTTRVEGGYGRTGKCGGSECVV